MFWKKPSKEERSSWIQLALAEWCEPRGFIHLPDKNQFRKRIETGFQTIIMSLSHYDKTTLFELHLGVRNDLVEQLAFQFTNNLPLFERDSMTLVASIGKLQNKPYLRHEITTEAEAQSTIEASIAFLEQPGLAWLEKYHNAAAVDEALNTHPLQRTKLMPNQVYRCYRGLSAAKMVHNPNYTKLVKQYRALLTELRTPDYQLQSFERLVVFLDQYSAN